MSQSDIRHGFMTLPRCHVNGNKKPGRKDHQSGWCISNTISSCTVYISRTTSFIQIDIHYSINYHTIPCKSLIPWSICYTSKLEVWCAKRIIDYTKKTFQQNFAVLFIQFHNCCIKNIISLTNIYRHIYMLEYLHET